jgi:hypothetical protein
MRAMNDQECHRHITVSSHAAALGLAFGDAGEWLPR